MDVNTSTPVFMSVSVSDKVTFALQTLLEVVSPEEEERLLGSTET